MAAWFRLARLYLVLLAIFTVGRFLMFNQPYEKGHQVFSIVTLTLLGSAFYGGFTRRYLGFTLGRAALTAIGLGLASQLTIMTATALSYALGMHTYFNHPTALNQPAAVGFAQAMGIRVGGLVVNCILASIAGSIGWALGALLPEAERAR